MYHFQHFKNHTNLQFTALHIYIHSNKYVVIVIVGYLFDVSISA